MSAPARAPARPRRYYLDRAASGSDDRGRAMALGAAIEIHELSNGN